MYLESWVVWHARRHGRTCAGARAWVLLLVAPVVYVFCLHDLECAVHHVDNKKAEKQEKQRENKLVKNKKNERKPKPTNL